MEANPNDPNDTPLDFYRDVPFSNYLNRMSIDGTFGDEITLRDAAELFNIEFVIISTLNRAAEATITSQNFAPQGRVYFGYLFLIQLKIPISLMNLLILNQKILPINRSLSKSKILIKQIICPFQSGNKIPINRLAICRLN